MSLTPLIRNFNSIQKKTKQNKTKKKKKKNQAPVVQKLDSPFHQIII